MIRHVVAWKLNPMDEGRRAEAVEAMREALESLAGQVPGLLSISVRGDVSGADGNWDAVLVSDHESLDALAGYQAHPAHVAAAAVPRQYAAQRASVDFEVPAPE